MQRASIRCCYHRRSRHPAFGRNCRRRFLVGRISRAKGRTPVRIMLEVRSRCHGNGCQASRRTWRGRGRPRPVNGMMMRRMLPRSIENFDTGSFVRLARRRGSLSFRSRVSGRWSFSGRAHSRVRRITMNDRRDTIRPIGQTTLRDIIRRNRRRLDRHRRSR